MLEYNITRKDLVNDYEDIVYDNIELSDYLTIYGDKMIVTVTCHDDVQLRRNDPITVHMSHIYQDPEFGVIVNEPEITEFSVFSVDSESRKFSVIAPKYKVLSDPSVTLVQDGEDRFYIEFGFEKPHLFEDMPVIPENVSEVSDGDEEGDGEEEEEPYISSYENFLYVYYNGSGDYARLYGLEYIDAYTVRWVYDSSVDNITEMCDVVFPLWDGSSDIPSDMYGETEEITVRRTQTLWHSSSDLMSDGPVIEHPVYRVSVPVPLSLTHAVDTYHDDNVREHFVDSEKSKAINRYAEMEKCVYRPVFIKYKDGGDYVFDFVRRINFNLHLRTHSGDNWLVENSDTWNFAAYGSGPHGSKYYSYNTDTRSNQADLLSYLGFNDSDVRYQKNKLKKSFLRLTFYDSDKPGSQNLLAYSTVFMNSGLLYSKLLSRSQSDVYFTQDGFPVSGVKVNREVDEARLMSKLGVSSVSDETIEDYRLSSQISVTDAMMSDSSSEGFNLYLWADDNSSILPSDIYMRAEFSHAGYGRTIPLMMPYKDDNVTNPNMGTHGFKTNDDIAGDWTEVSTQYDITKYLKYSYLKLKYRYDKELKKHIYYIDPERYGESFGSTLNINLYEARVAFND